ncbi:DUF3995 domain-containing protein [Streptomyces sp. NPDC059874]|uniref:DUF3995 domain-containing protein n=1 Tax=Streptomyces sp. NPDC059874 TaxID=3346983 RepID=UPI0036626836
MKTTTRHRTGQAVAGVLAVDGLLHLYWATGATWPAVDARSLSLAVLGLEAPFTPRVVVPLAALLLTGAGAVMVYSRGRGGRTARLVTGAVAAGLAARGLAGLGWVTGLTASPAEGPFRLLNLVLYTPVCLGLAWATARLCSSPTPTPPNSGARGTGRRRRTS